MSHLLQPHTQAQGLCHCPSLSIWWPFLPLHPCYLDSSFKIQVFSRGSHRDRQSSEPPAFNALDLWLCLLVSPRPLPGRAFPWAQQSWLQSHSFHSDRAHVHLFRDAFLDDPAHRSLFEFSVKHLLLPDIFMYGFFFLPRLDCKPCGIRDGFVSFTSASSEPSTVLGI